MKPRLERWLERSIPPMLVIASIGAAAAIVILVVRIVRGDFS